MMPMWTSHKNSFHNDLIVLCRHRIASGLVMLSRREEGIHEYIYLCVIGNISFVNKNYLINETPG